MRLNIDSNSICKASKNSFLLKHSIELSRFIKIIISLAVTTPFTKQLRLLTCLKPFE